MEHSGSVRRLTITRGQVASKLGISERTFEKKRQALEADGFPKKLPGMNAWSEPAVDRWFATAGMEATIEPVKVAAIVDATRELESEYAA